jgi:protease inhibitor Inh
MLAQVGRRSASAGVLGLLFPAFFRFPDRRMIGVGLNGSWTGRRARTAAALIVLAALAACAEGEHLGATRAEPPPSAAAPPPPPPPPPTDLAGRWKLSAAAGGACFMTFGGSPGAAQGTIAPEGGCPGNFFTSRKWTFERGVLIVRDHKGEPLAQFAVGGNRLDGQATNGAQLSLSR